MPILPADDGSLDEFGNEEKAELDRFAEWLSRNPIAIRWAEEMLRQLESRQEGEHGEA